MSFHETMGWAEMQSTTALHCTVQYSTVDECACSLAGGNLQRLREVSKYIPYFKINAMND